MIRKCKLCGAEFEGVSRDVKCQACRKIWRICREELK